MGGSFSHAAATASCPWVSGDRVAPAAASAALAALAERPSQDLLLHVHAAGLAAELAEVEQAVAVHVAAGQDLDPLVAGAVQREDALHADAEGHLPHGEGGAVRALGLADDHALEGLHALLLALPTFQWTRTVSPVRNVGEVLAQVLGLDVLDGAAAHDDSSNP